MRAFLGCRCQKSICQLVDSLNGLKFVLFLNSLQKKAPETFLGPGSLGTAPDYKPWTGTGILVRQISIVIKNIRNPRLIIRCQIGVAVN